MGRHIKFLSLALWLLLSVGQLSGAATAVQDILYSQDGVTPATGEITIRNQPFRTIENKYIPANVQLVEVGTDGVVNVSLEATDTATPAGSAYTVEYDIRDATTGQTVRDYIAYWMVITSASPVQIGEIEQITPPTPSLGILLQQLDPGNVAVASEDWRPAWNAATRRYEPRPPGGAGSGEINTGANVGTGAGVYRDKTAAVLNFRSFLSANTLLTVTQNADDLTFTVNQGNFALPSIGGLLTMEQIEQRSATDGQAMLWSNTLGRWDPGTVGGGGDGGITNLNTLTALVQTFSEGTAGSDFNIVSAGSNHAFNFPDASAAARGLLTAADWSAFNAPSEPPITPGTITQFWRGDKTFQELTTGAVSENVNLYFTDARARGALSGLSPILFDSGTGVISHGVSLKAHLPAVTVYTDQANVFTAAGGVTMDNQLGIRLRELGSNGSDHLEMRSIPDRTGSYSFLWAVSGACDALANGGKLTIDAANQLKCDNDVGGGAGGDNITVNGVSATDPNFNDALPAAPAGATLVKWLKDTNAPDNVSAHMLWADVVNQIGSTQVDIPDLEPNLTLNNIGGELGITKGGHGQTTALAGFDALSPTTTRGDLIARGISANERVAIGGAATFLRSDGLDPGWAAIADGDVPNTITLDNLTQITTRSHADLQDLTADDHTQYARLGGRGAGQTLTGGVDAGGDLTFATTANVSKGDYIFAELATVGFVRTGVTGALSTAPIANADLPTVDISHGGTGQTTAVAGFDALAPTTTRGDLITRGVSGNVRTAIGANLTVFGSDGTDPAWTALTEAHIPAVFVRKVGDTMSGNLDFSGTATARLPNNVYMQAENNAGGGYINLIKIDTFDDIYVGDVGNRIHLNGNELYFRNTALNTKISLNSGYGIGYQANQFRFHVAGAGTYYSFLDASNGNEIFRILGDGGAQWYDRGTKPTCNAGALGLTWLDDAATDTFEACGDFEGTGPAWYSMVAAGGGGGAPTTSTYILQTPDGALPNSQALSALATGILKNTTATGVLSIAAEADFPAELARRNLENIFTAAGGLTMDNQLGVRLRELGGTDYIELRSIAARTGNYVLDIALTNNCSALSNGGKLTVNASDQVVCDNDVGGGSGGDDVSINGVSATNPNFNDTTPAAPAGATLLKWLKDTSAPDNVSAHMLWADVVNEIGSAQIDIPDLEPNLTLNNIGGILGITKGGHGQATAVAGFDALAPTTTRGDIIARGISANERLAIGANLTVFGSDGTDPTWTALTDGHIPNTITLDNLTQITTRSHADLQDLTADDHTQYALLAGRGAGQTLNGGADAGGDLTLSTTANASKGDYILADLASIGFVRTGATGILSTSPIANADLPTVDIAHGGTGQTDATAAFDALAPTSVRGDLIVRGVAGNGKVAIGANLTVFGSDGTDPAWIAITNAHLPTVDVGHGGTGGTTWTTNGVLLGNTTSPLSATAAGTANQVLRVPGAGGAPAFGAIDLAQAAAVTGLLGTANLADAVVRQIKTIPIENVDAALAGKIRAKLPNAATITRVSCDTDQGTVPMQFDERAEGTPNTAGTDVLTASLTCSTTTGVTTSFSNATIAANAPLGIKPGAPTGGPSFVNLHIEYTVD